MKQLLTITVLLTSLIYCNAQIECAAGANSCAETLFNAESTANSTQEICTAVDVAILCIADATVTCDPIAAADVAASMSAIIAEYKAPPNNCTLVNENNPAFDLDPCSEGLAYCSEVLYTASIDTDLSQSCRLKEQYKECMIVNTTACDSSIQPTIDKNVAEAEITYANQPYFCQERLSEDLTVCDNEYANCNNGLTGIGVTAQTSSEVCPIVDSFSTCIQVLTCPTRIHNYFTAVATNLTDSFKELPYFCGSANACQDLFDACNETLSVNIPEPCSLVESHAACLGNIESLCETTQMTDIRTTVEGLNAVIIDASPTGCQTTTEGTSNINPTQSTSYPAPTKDITEQTTVLQTPANIQTGKSTTIVDGNTQKDSTTVAKSGDIVTDIVNGASQTDRTTTARYVSTTTRKIYTTNKADGSIGNTKRSDNSANYSRITFSILMTSLISAFFIFS